MHSYDDVLQITKQTMYNTCIPTSNRDIHTGVRELQFSSVQFMCSERTFILHGNRVLRADTVQAGQVACVTDRPYLVGKTVSSLTSDCIIDRT